MSNRNIYDETLEELQRYVDGDRTGIKVRVREYKPVVPVKDYSGKQIKQLREQNNFTQDYFGKILGVSLKTIQAWENETNKPTGTALRMFQLLEKNPHVLEEYDIVMM